MHRSLLRRALLSLMILAAAWAITAYLAILPPATGARWHESPALAVEP